MCLLVFIASTENARWINDCNIMFHRLILYTIATYLFNLKHVNLLQQSIILLCLNAHTCLLLKPPFMCFVILYGYVLLFKYIWLILARSLCIVLFSTRYWVHTTSCTRTSVSSRSVPRVNHVRLFLLMTT